MESEEADQRAEAGGKEGEARPGQSEERVRCDEREGGEGAEKEESD